MSPLALHVRTAHPTFEEVARGAVGDALQVKLFCRFPSDALQQGDPEKSSFHLVVLLPLRYPASFKSSAEGTAFARPLSRARCPAPFPFEVRPSPFGLVGDGGAGQVCLELQLQPLDHIDVFVDQT